MEILEGVAALCVQRLLHGDLLVGELPVILSGKVAPRLLEIGEAVDPHLGEGEGVAPSDDASTGLVVVGFPNRFGYLLVGFGGYSING